MVALIGHGTMRRQGAVGLDLPAACLRPLCSHAWSTGLLHPFPKLYVHLSKGFSVLVVDRLQQKPWNKRKALLLCQHHLRKQPLKERR